MSNSFRSSVGLVCWVSAAVLIFAAGMAYAQQAESGHGTPATHEAASGHSEKAAKHEEHPPEVPDILWILKNNTSGSVSEFIDAVRIPVYSIFFAAFLVLLFRSQTRNLKKIPGLAQCAVEMYVEMMDDFVCSILGKEMGRKYLPFLGTVAIYIWCMNLSCLVPGLVPPTSYPTQTFGLSILVFLYVQYTAVRYNGVLGYLFHLANEPRDLLGYILAPLFFPLHVIGELIRPVSLGLRLWGNVLGEDILIGVFSGLGIMLVPLLTSLVGWHIENPIIGIPLHLLVIPLVLIGSTVQAVVFTALSTIYVSLVLPHHEHAEDHAPAGAH